MLSGKTISLKNVISKVYSGLNIKDESQYINIIEWLGEAISKIKTDAQLESVCTTLCIDNHRAELPCDFMYLSEVDYKGFQLTKASANHLVKTNHDNIGIYNQYDYVDKRLDGLKNIAYCKGQKYEFIGGDSFTIDKGWFKTSFFKGDVKITYKRLPVDDEGFPLVPEEESYREALFWYCAWKYFFIRKIEANGNEFNKFNNLSLEAEQKWHWYCGQAGAESLMPDLYMLENIKRNFLTLVPKADSFQTFFSNLNNG